MSNQVGRVVAVSLRATSGVPKHPQSQVVIGEMGVQGDFHAGPINKHKKKGDPEPNRRQVTVVAKEVLDSLNAELGTHLQPGDVGENIQLEGHGDLSDLVPGDRIRLGADAVLEVTAQNTPCSTISIYHDRLVKSAYGRRGVAAVVVATGVVRPGDVSVVERGELRKD